MQTTSPRRAELSWLLLDPVGDREGDLVLFDARVEDLSPSKEAACGSRKTRAPCSSITSSSSAGTGTMLSWKFARVPARSATIRRPVVSATSYEDETMFF